MVTTNTATVTALYQSLTGGQNPPAAELAVYTAQLNSGALTVAQVTSFIENSTFVTNAVDPVIRAFQTVFGHVPSQADLTLWVGLIAPSGPTGAFNTSVLTSIYTSLASTPEFQSLYGSSFTPSTVVTAANGAALVTALYRNVAGQAMDSVGLAYWLSQNITVSQLLQTFALSAEASNGMSPGIVTFENSEAAGAPMSGSLYNLIPYAPPSGPQTLYLLTGGQTVTGTGSNNVASYANLSGAVVVDDTTGSDNLGDHFSNIQAVVGSNNSDTFTLGGGVKTVTGGYGYDTYKFNIGSGVQTIVNGVSGNSGPKGILQLGPGIDRSNLWITQSGSDLLVSALGSDQLTVKNWFSNSYSQVDQLVLSDGSTVFSSQITALANLMGAYQTNRPGVPIYTFLGIDPGLKAAIGAAWAGTVAIVSGQNQTFSAATLGVQAVFDTAGGGNTLIGNASSTIVGGNNDTLTGSGVFVVDGRGVTVQGTPSQVDVTLGGIVSFSGGAYIVYATNDTLNGSISSTGVTSVYASNSTVSLSGGTLFISGDYNVVTQNTAILWEAGQTNGITMVSDGQQAVLAGVSSSVTAAGNNQTVALLGTGEQVDLRGTSDHVTVYGSAVITVEGANDSLALFGTNITITSQGGAGTVAYLAQNGSATYTSFTGRGSTSEFDLDVGARLNLQTGGGNTVNGSHGGGATITASNALSGTYAPDTLNLAGVGNSVTLGAGVAGDTINVDTTGNGPGVSLTYSGSGSTLNLGSSSVVWAAGDANAFNFSSAQITVASGGGDTFNYSGSGNVIAASNATLNSVGAAGVTYTGAGSTLNLSEGSSASVIGSNNTVNGGETGSFTIVSGSGNTINFGFGSHAPGQSAMVTASGGATVNAGANSQFTYFGNGGTLNLGLNAKVDVIGSSNVFNETGGVFTVHSATSNNNVFNLSGVSGDGTATTITQQSGASGTVVNGGGVLYVVGGGVTVNSSAQEAVFVQGAGNQINLISNGTKIDFNGAIGSNLITNTTSASPVGSLVMVNPQGSANVWFDKSGNDLKITEMGHAQTIVIANWFAGGTHQLQTIATDFSEISNTNVTGLVSTMASYEASYAASHGGTAFDPTLIGAVTDPTMLAAINAAWHL